MRKTRSTAITASILVTLGALLLILLSLGEREPVYQGQTLTYWLSDFWPGRTPSPEKLEQDKLAVRQIGTNAIPILLQWVSAEDTPLKKEMVTWISRHPWVPFRLESSLDKNMLAVSGFSILGKSQATSAVPALVEIVKSGGGPAYGNVRNVTFPMLVLTDLDPEAATRAGIRLVTNSWRGGKAHLVPISWSPPPASTNK